MYNKSREIQHILDIMNTNFDLIKKFPNICQLCGCAITLRVSQFTEGYVVCLNSTLIVLYVEMHLFQLLFYYHGHCGFRFAHYFQKCQVPVPVFISLVLINEMKIISFLELAFSSPGLYVSFCHHLVPVNFSHFNLLLQNWSTLLNQTWQGWSLGRGD